MISMTREDLIKTAIELLKEEGFQDVKANLEGYRKPEEIISKITYRRIIPDLTAKKDHRIYVFKIVLEDEPDIDIWYIISNYVQINNGIFYLMVPQDKEKEIQKKLWEYKINAQLIQLQVS